jgi:hypothetical protein
MPNRVRRLLKFPRPGGAKESSPSGPESRDTKAAQRMEGRTAIPIAIAIGQVFRGQVPMRSGMRSLLFRIVRTRKAYLYIHLTALPGDPPIKRGRHVWIERADLETLMATKLAFPVHHLSCPTCSHSMSLYSGFKAKRQTIMFACDGCEEFLEV